MLPWSPNETKKQGKKNYRSIFLDESRGKNVQVITGKSISTTHQKDHTPGPRGIHYNGERIS